MAAGVDGFQQITSNQENVVFSALSGGGNISLIDWPASLPLRGYNQRGGPHILAVLSTLYSWFF
jgi:hypothetical protein